MNHTKPTFTFNAYNNFIFNTHLPLTDRQTIEANNRNQLTSLQQEALRHGRKQMVNGAIAPIFIGLILIFLPLIILRSFIEPFMQLLQTSPFSNYMLLGVAIISMVLFLLAIYRILPLIRSLQTPTNFSNVSIDLVMGELRYLKRKGFVFEATNGRYLPIPALTHLLPGRYQAHLLANGRWLLSATPIDPPTTLYDNYQQLLAKTFGFRPQDLDLNNQGELSFYQKCLATFRRAIVYIIPIFLFSLPGYFFLLFIGLIILLDVGHYIYNLWFLPLETVQGEIITSYYYRHTGRGKSKRYYIAQVNNQNLHITHQQYEVLQSKLTYQIYYVKDHIMSLKLIDTNLS